MRAAGRGGAGRTRAWLPHRLAGGDRRREGQEGAGKKGGGALAGCAAVAMPTSMWLHLPMSLSFRHRSKVGIQHVRFRIRDFDPYDLRLKLPKAVAKLASVHDPSQGLVYIHCTAGTPPSSVSASAASRVPAAPPPQAPGRRRPGGGDGGTAGSCGPRGGRSAVGSLGLPRR